MGVVHYEPQIEDDFSAEVIRLARERSDDIDDWFNARKYILEISDDEITPLWLRKRCLTLVMDELAERGININVDAVQVFSDPQLIYTVLMLLSKFSEENLKKLLKDHPPLMEAVESNLGPDLFETIVDWCDEFLPLDDGWTLVKRTFDEYPGVLDGESQKFIQHVQGVVDAVNRLGDPDISYFVDEDLYLKYVQFLLKRQQFVRAYCDMWINRGENDYQRKSRADMIDAYLGRGFEKELASKEVFVKWADAFEHLDLGDLQAVIGFLEKIREPYRCRWAHDLKHYCCEEHVACPDSMLTIMIASMVVDCPHQLNLNTAIPAKIEEYVDQLGNDSVNALKDAFADLMSNLSKPVEVNYVAE